MNTKKIVLSFIATIIFVWLSQFKILAYLPDKGYILDIFLFLYPIFLPASIALYFFIRGNKEITYGVIIGSFIYCFGFWLLLFWGIEEMGCTRYFFNLFTTCPGIK